MSTRTDAEVGLQLATCWWPRVERAALLQPETWLWSYMATVKCLHLVILTQQNGSLGRCTSQGHLGQLQASNKPLWNQIKRKAIFSHFSPLSKQVSDPPWVPAPLQLYKMEPNCTLTDIKIISCWISLAYAVPDVWQNWRMLPGGAPSLGVLAGCCS